MTSDTAAFDLPAPPPPPAPSDHAPARHGWVGSDLALGSALIVLLIALFLPWFSASVRVGAVSLGVTESGAAAHGYLWWAFVLGIVGLIALTAREFTARVRGNLPSGGQIIVGVTFLALVLVILAFTLKPAYLTGSGGTVIQAVRLPLATATPVAWSYGGYVAIIAAAVAFLAAAGAALPVRAAAQAARAGWQRPETRSQDA